MKGRICLLLGRIKVFSGDIMAHETHHTSHHYAQKEELPEGRLALFWIMGAVSMLAGAWIAGRLEWVLGTTALSYYGALFVSFLLFLFGGLAWIGVAVSVAHHKG